MARKRNMVSMDKIGRNVAMKVGIDNNTCRTICRAFIKELENQIKDGHIVSLGRIGYMEAKWYEPHGCIKSGHYRMQFKFSSKLKRFVRGMENGDFDLPYVDMYQDGIVTENGILRKRKEDKEFFND